MYAGQRKSLICIAMSLRCLKNFTSTSAFSIFDLTEYECIPIFIFNYLFFTFLYHCPFVEFPYLFNSFTSFLPLFKFNILLIIHYFSFLLSHLNKTVLKNILHSNWKKKIRFIGNYKKMENTKRITLYDFFSNKSESTKT